MSSGFRVVAGENVLNDYDAASNGVVLDGIKVLGEQATAIADLTAITGGESPTEAEHNLIVTKVNAILAMLRTHGVIAT